MLIHIRVFLINFSLTSIYISVCNDEEYIREKACVSCQGHCYNGEPCNKLTGRCDNGCQNYWTGTFCEGVYKTFSHAFLKAFLTMTNYMVH